MVLVRSMDMEKVGTEAMFWTGPGQKKMLGSLPGWEKKRDGSKGKNRENSLHSLVCFINTVQ